MKIVISDNPPYFLGLDAPTLLAYEHTDSFDRTLLVVWCDHCGIWHWHGAGEGHREAHCRGPGSPYERRGYNLAYAGEWYGPGG